MEQARAQLAVVADLLKKELLEARERTETERQLKPKGFDAMRDGRELAKRSVIAFRESLNA